ncbi:VOC family protein [Streptomyces marincola]|uniref:VOC family protein n=1 Tax=Streptomyces marincola TaxID=2878388 RepID=UPI001CF2A6D9|nr:VOC family protein [Streptomyces marincola]UCM88171.1 VOC family protein [Streptomyces marincola]
MALTFTRPPGATTLMHVAVMCPDIDASLRFYQEGLGFTRRYEFTESATREGQVVYRGRGIYVELEGHAYVELFPGGRPGVTSEDGPLAHIALIVPDVDEAYRSSLRAGGLPHGLGDWTGEPMSLTLNGSPEVDVRVAFVRGPAGELIELYEQHSPIVAR